MKPRTEEVTMMDAFKAGFAIGMVATAIFIAIIQAA